MLRYLALRLGLVALLVVFTFPARADLLAGAAKVNLTPDVKASKIPLGGYAARFAAAAKGVDTPIYVRALVLSEGKRKIAVVSADLCFLPASVKAEVERRLAGSEFQSPEAGFLFLAATHSHTAPDPLAMHRGNTIRDLKGWTLFDPQLLDFTAERIAEAVRLATKRLAPARLSLSRFATNGLNRNRRGDPLTDTEMTLLKLTAAEGGRPLAVVCNFAAHPTLYDEKMMEVSPDWPGVMTETVERDLGEPCVCLFLNGAEGDATVEGANGTTPKERVANYGAKIAQVVLEGVKGATPEANPNLKAWEHRFALPPRKANGLFLFAAATLGATFEKARSLVNTIMPEETAIAFVKIGSLTLMGFPCEPSSEIGLAAKAAAKRAGVASPAIVALVNDWLAYCITEKQYRIGKYEATMSFYGEGFGDAMLKGTEAGLERGK